MNEKNLKTNAFTLAETIIVLVILGIVAAVTIPTLIRRHVEATNRTKIKKAMQVYDTALSKMVIENGLKSNDALTEWAGANCENSTNYFKKNEGAGCLFKSSDGVWWYIDPITNPIISLKEIKLAELETIRANAADSSNTTAFYMVGRFDNDGVT